MPALHCYRQGYGAVKINVDVKRKKYIIKTVIECVKESNIFIGLKKTCLGVLE